MKRQNDFWYIHFWESPKQSLEVWFYEVHVHADRQNCCCEKLIVLTLHVHLFSGWLHAISISNCRFLGSENSYIPTHYSQPGTQQREGILQVFVDRAVCQWKFVGKWWQAGGNWSF